MASSSSLRTLWRHLLFSPSKPQQRVSSALPPRSSESSSSSCSSLPMMRGAAVMKSSSSLLPSTRPPLPPTGGCGMGGRSGGGAAVRLSAHHQFLSRRSLFSSSGGGGKGGLGGGVGKEGGAPSPLTRNVSFTEVVKPQWVIEPPNYTRMPLWRQYWEAQFANRSFFFFGNAWTSAISFALFLWWSRVFDPPPKERLDRYWLNSPKFRILSAFHNPGKRPALKISLMTWETRYFYRGLDHPFGLNELKDFWFKVKENFLIARHPGVQYPFVFRNFNRVKTPGTLEVHTYPTPQKTPHFEGDEGAGHGGGH